MITKLSIHNYKGFMNFEMECGRIVFLMGRNGSGKSSLFDVLRALARVIHEGDLEVLFYAQDRNRFADEPNMRFEVASQHGSSNFRYLLTVGFADKEKKPSIVREELLVDELSVFLFKDGVVHNLGDASALFPLNLQHGGLALMGDRSALQTLTTFKSWWRRFLLLRLTPATVISEARKPISTLSVDGSNFADWYEGVTNADTAVAVDYWNALREVIPDLASVNLTPMHRGKLFEVVLRANGQRRPFALDELSEGQISLMIHYAILHYCTRQGVTVALDEPDNYIALSELEPLIYAFEDAVHENSSQLFVISHHPEFYNQWARESDKCRYLERVDGRFEARTIDWDDHPGLTSAEVVARGWQDA